MRGGGNERERECKEEVGPNDRSETSGEWMCEDTGGGAGFTVTALPRTRGVSA
jgi:hypothetical protein